MPTTQKVFNKCLMGWFHDIRLGYVSVDYQADILNSGTLWQFSQLQHWQITDYYLTCPIWACWEIWEETVHNAFAHFTFLIWSRAGQRYIIFQKSLKLCLPGHLTHFWNVSLFSFSCRPKMPMTSMQIDNMSNRQTKLIWGKGLWHSHHVPILFFRLLLY